jgi:MoaA/NifB/PqqE/SkfB family radical SAM enzyme
MTSTNCNQRCASCYIDFPTQKNIKDFISVEKVKETLAETKSEDIHCIYLLGAEPMTHPDFNTILRLCLKRCNVCICTNGSFLNEKKIRFLKKTPTLSEKSGKFPRREEGPFQMTEKMG